MQKNSHSLSITRQVIQDIWHVACQTQAQSVFGLLGASDDGVICRIQHLSHLNEKIITDLANLWAKDGVFIQGSFQSKPLNLQYMQENDVTTLFYKKHYPTKTWVYLALNIDTQGCLKSTLHCLKENECIELPMMLVDHGQSRMPLYSKLP